MVGISIKPPAPLRPAHDHIDFAAAAFGTDQPLAPIGHGRFGAVALRLLGRIGLYLVAAIAAPNDQPDVGGGGIAERYRRAELRFIRHLRVAGHLMIVAQKGSAYCSLDQEARCINDGTVSAPLLASQLQMKPKIFIGSSMEGKPFADAIHSELQSEAECTVWTQGVFGLSESTIESLMKEVDTSEFGVFVFSPDDAVRVRGKLFSAPRDNVVYELGLFSGALGRERCFFVTPEGTDIHLPTDLLGMTAGWYETRRRDHNLQAAVGPFCTKVRNEIRELTLGVRFLSPERNAQLPVGQHTFRCQCTSRPVPDVVLFTQKGNRWWPRREKLKQVPNTTDTYEIDFGFGDPGSLTIHATKTNDLGKTLVNYYSDIANRTAKQWEELKRTGLPEATLNGLRISYPPIIMEELPRGFVELASITVEVVPKPA